MPFFIYIKTCLILSTQIWHQPPSSQEKWCRACWLFSLGSWLSIARGCKNSRNQWPDSGFVPSSRYVEDRVWRLHQPTRSWNTSTNTWVLCLQWGRFKNKIPKWRKGGKSMWKSSKCTDRRHWVQSNFYGEWCAIKTNNHNNGSILRGHRDNTRNNAQGKQSFPSEFIKRKINTKQLLAERL